jgi:hypothetical protein
VDLARPVHGHFLWINPVQSLGDDLGELGSANSQFFSIGKPTLIAAGRLKDLLDEACNITPGASYVIRCRRQSNISVLAAPSLDKSGTTYCPGFV